MRVLAPCHEFSEFLVKHDLRTTGLPEMTTDYDQIAEQYRKEKERPWRSRIEAYSLMKLVGDVTGKKVVDVACGEGFFTRKLRQAGAAEVLGTDVSERMIELAKAEEAKNPLGVEYAVEDARATKPQRDCDLAVASWLLVYAHDRGELDQMCRGLARLLKPGGRFVTLTTNPDLYTFDRPDYRKYGFDVSVEDRVYEGAPIRFTCYVEDSTIEIENYYLSVTAYAKAFRNAGFRDFTVRMPELAPNPTGEDEKDYWDDFLNYPSAILIDCVKE